MLSRVDPLSRGRSHASSSQRLDCWLIKGTESPTAWRVSARLACMTLIVLCICLDTRLMPAQHITDCISVHVMLCACKYTYRYVHSVYQRCQAYTCSTSLADCRMASRNAHTSGRNRQQHSVSTAHFRHKTHLHFILQRNGTEVDTLDDRRYAGIIDYRKTSVSPRIL